MLRKPSESSARCIGLVRPIDGTKLYDWPLSAQAAGLAAAVYAASEGLSVIVLDCHPRLRRAGRRLLAHPKTISFPTGFGDWR